MILPGGAIHRNVIGLLVLLCSGINYHGAISDYENKFVQGMQSVVIVEGRIANLPCDVKPSFRGDRIHIVIWYKKSDNGKLTPIYTFDSRDNLYFEEGKHWSDVLVLGGRAYFRFQDEPAKLVINSILRSDAGVYQCRVDFKQSPTRSSEVNLTVIVPPSEVTILNERGFQVTDYYLGPYKEGASINVTCVCTGGFPAPKLTWWQENALLDDSYENLSGNIVRNVLHIERLERKHLNVVLTCQASNNEVAAPIGISRSLDINLRPLSVQILGQNKPLSEGRTYQLQCEVVGSRPTALISWWKGGTKLGGPPATVNTNGNVTISTVPFTPSLNDEGKYISCIVEQLQFSKDIIERRRKLSIHHVPLVSLELSNKGSNGIEEGSDVYFECNIKSNPWVYKLSWTYNGKMLYSNRTEGIILSNQSLVLQDVSKDRSGIYTCIGINQEGEGESNPVRLEIMFSPLCHKRQVVVYEVSLHETVSINCAVDANPAAFEFAWELSNTEVSPNVIPFHETSSTISYTPIHINDYGMLFCMASNLVGKQKQPCAFQITFIDKPNPLTNCSLLNRTHQSLLVNCAYHLSDAFKQEFIAEVYDAQTHKLLKNTSSDSPRFLITGLMQTLEIEIHLYVTSEAAKSKTTRLKAIIPKLEKTLAASVPVRLYITPRLSITICVVLIVIFTTVVILATCRLCGKGKHNGKKYNNSGISTSNVDEQNRDHSTGNTENINPDVIPLRNAKVQEEEGFIDELIHKGPSETYVKLEDPKEIITNLAKNSALGSLKSQPRFMMYPNWQPPILGLPLQYDSALLRNPEAFPFLPHRPPNAKVYRSGVHSDLSEPLQEEWAPMNPQDNRNVLQPPLRARNIPSRSPQHQIKITQI